MGSEREVFIEWMTPQSEYSPTKYIQGWMQWWWDDDKRLQAAQLMQVARIEFVRSVWSRDKEFKQYSFDSSNEHITSLLHKHKSQIMLQDSAMHLLQLEAQLTKALYKLAAQNTEYSGFTRGHEGIDKANRFLNHGNYLAYGLGATTA